MSTSRYTPLRTSSEDSIDHQYRDDVYEEREHGSPFGRRAPASWQYQYGAQRELGLVEKGKRQYWTGKQYVREKMGKEQDQFQVADDAELDSQMERARHIQKQCLALCRALLRYQEVVQQLTSRQVALSSLLRAYSENESDAPCAEMMSRLGTVLQDEAVSRLELDVPLTRFFSEVETFRCRALVDTLINVNQVTLERRKFRGALLWMADASRNLDPDTRKQLAKFRQAQQMAREARQEFEGKKGVVCEKVDLLGASFCNLLSHAMTPYQKVIGQQWNRSAQQYRQLLDWSRETLRHQYRLQRDVLRDRERQVEADDEESAQEAGEQLQGATQGDTSESWSEGRLLSVIGEPLLAKKVEDAEDAVKAEEEEASREKQASNSSEAASELLDVTEQTEVAPGGGGDEFAATDPSVPPPTAEKTGGGQQDFNWLELMTEGSAAAALADFAGDTAGVAPQSQSQQVHQALLDLARTSTTSGAAELAQAEALSGQTEDILSYEMTGSEQQLQGMPGIRQLTNDEARLDQLVPMDSSLRQRQELDKKMETQLEEELAQMVNDFSSLAALPSALGSDLTGSAGHQTHGLPGDLLDMNDGSSSAVGSLFAAGSQGGFAPGAPLARAQPPGNTSVAPSTGHGFQSGSAGGQHAAPEGGGPAQQPAKASSGTDPSRKQKWFDLFSELDPLSNPDDLRLDQDAPKSDDGATEKLAL